MIELKTSDQIEVMNESNTIVHEVLDYAEEKAEVGMTTLELDNLMENKLSEYKGATSAFKGYLNYPNVSCISVNSVIVHGIPSDYKLQDGDIVSVDFGVYYKGWAGDSAKTFIIGNPKDIAHVQLISDTQRALFAGIEKMVPGNRLYDINEAINKISVNKYGNIRHFCGHGIGKKMHEKPSVFNYIESREPNIRLIEGLVLALEPMFSLGTWKTKILEDNWTVITLDNSMAAHWELSIAITSDGPRILGKGFNTYEHRKNTA